MVTKREALAAAHRWIEAERDDSGQRGTEEILEIIAGALVDDDNSLGARTAGLIDDRLKTVHAALNVPIRLLTEEQIEMLRVYIASMTPVSRAVSSHQREKYRLPTTISDSPSVFQERFTAIRIDCWDSGG